MASVAEEITATHWMKLCKLDARERGGDMEGTITAERFEEQLSELINEERDRDGYTGEILGLIMDAARLPGELYSDHDCLQLIHRIVNHWSEVVDL